MLRLLDKAHHVLTPVLTTTNHRRYTCRHGYGCGGFATCCCAREHALVAADVTLRRAA